jgi:putative tryptophan/tyrosine transport system substrate-binding protein
MRRREFIAGLGGAAAWPIVARAQQPGRVQRLGMLMGGLENDSEAEKIFTAVRQELERLGWTVGRNLQIDVRWSAILPDRARAGAAELLRMAPDVIWIIGTGPGVAALQQATSTTPIVFVNIIEPVARGFVASLARPGGNITGFSHLEPTLGAKWLQMLKEIAPNTRRVAVVINPETIPFNIAFSRSAEEVAPKFDVEVNLASVHEPAEIEAVMTRLAREPGGGLIFPPDFSTSTHRHLIVEMAARYRLPAAYAGRQFPEAGGLLSYGADPLDISRRSVAYVDRILRGEKPADLPVQQPTRFELVVNMKTAKALGLTIPPNLLALADEVIE